MFKVDTPQSICRAGMARRDITPPAGIYHRMWGAATHDRATGVHRPLTATALALAPSKAASQSQVSSDVQVIVAIDHCLLWNRDMEALVERTAAISGLLPSQMHVAFSHTHAAGLMDPRRAALPGGELIAPYLARLAEQIGDAASQAVRGLADAVIVYGQGSCTLARNRDLWDGDSGQFVCGLNPNGPADNTVLVACVHRANAGILCTLVNYACHPTTLAWDNTLVSPDYVGPMREVVEQATAAPCVFMQGASGDLGPREGYVGDVSVADKNGRQLGYAALAALESLDPPATRYQYTGPVVSGATIGTWAHRSLPSSEVTLKSRWTYRRLLIDLAYRSDLPTRAETESQLANWSAAEQSALAEGDQARARDCRAQVERMTRQLARLEGLPLGDKFELPVHLLRLGDALWVLTPGEHYQWLQTSLRERFCDHPLIVSTVTGGWSPGYVPTAETYGRGIYQESIALVAPGSLEKIVAQVGDALAQLL